MEYSISYTSLLEHTSRFGYQDWLVIVAVGVPLLPLVAIRYTYASAIFLTPLVVVALTYSGASMPIAAFVALSASLSVISITSVAGWRQVNALERRCLSLASRLNAIELSDARRQNVIAHSAIPATALYPVKARGLELLQSDPAKGKAEHDGALHVAAPADSNSIS